MALSSALLRFAGIFNRILQFVLGIVILGIYAYFVANIRDAGFRPNRTTQAVLGISIASTIYSLCGIVFTLCLGGNTFFGNLAIVVDILFIGLYIFVSYATRAARHGCSGYVATPLGDGWSGQETGLTIASSLRRACQLNTVVFSFAIALCIMFFMTAIWQYFMVNNSRRRKAYQTKA